MVGLFGRTKVEVSASDMTWLKRSLSLLEGEETEGWRCHSSEMRRNYLGHVVVEIDACRKPRLGLAGDNSTLGEAKRERVLRNADFLFGGIGIDKRAAGSLGFFT